jgi:hypothetical protein
LLSEKYLAGFIDADGHFSVRARLGARPDLEFSVAQAVEFQEPLLELQQEFGGTIRVRHDGKHAELQMRGAPARKVFERLKKYLVLKQDQAERFLDLVDRGVVLKTEADVKAIRKRVKEIRAYGATRQPNYPSRKWMAGYVDGDGCFTVKVCKKTGYAYPNLTILAAPNYLVGITLLQKAFGGRITAIGQNAVWTVALSQPSKIEQVLGHCAQHLRRKQAQAYFLLGCAKGGNLRDGDTIHRTIKALNAQQHRLSDPTAEVHKLLQSVNFDIERRCLGRPVGVSESKPRRKRQSEL